METEPHKPDLVSKELNEQRVARFCFRLLLALQGLMAVQLVFLILEHRWFSSVGLLAVMVITAAPVLFAQRLPVRIPPEYDILASLFAFATLFLGEFRSYYDRFWWWDIALHTTSGLLLGVVGFLLVYVLNESRRINVYMRPGFVALFAFAFAVTGGVLWEIFEFTMDQVLGTTMQKTMLGDPSGLTDTMWDLIVDTFGAALVSGFGWLNLRSNTHSFLEVWIEKFLERNPSLFVNPPK